MWGSGPGADLENLHPRVHHISYVDAVAGVDPQSAFAFGLRAATTLTSGVFGYSLQRKANQMEKAVTLVTL
jgi:hypothetical protein